MFYSILGMKNFARFLVKSAGLTSFSLFYFRVSSQAATNKVADAEKDKFWYPLKLMMGKTKSR